MLYRLFSGIYGNSDFIDRLRALYTEAIRHPEVAILSIATRPDCLQPEVLDLLSELNRIKPVWVELGLQSIHPQTAAHPARLSLSVYDAAVLNLHERGIEVITHVILRLPETADDMLATADYIAHQPIQGNVKFQLLHVLKGTDLYTDYLRQPFHVLTLEEYTDILIRCIEHMPPDVIIHRLPVTVPNICWLRTGAATRNRYLIIFTIA